MFLLPAGQQMILSRRLRFFEPVLVTIFERQVAILLVASKYFWCIMFNSVGVDKFVSRSACCPVFLRSNMPVIPHRVRP